MSGRFHGSTLRTLLITGLFASAGLAEPITFTFQGIGSGTLTATGSTTAEPFVNSPFTFSFTADTAQIKLSGTVFNTPLAGGGTVSIAGKTGTFPERLTLQLNTPQPNQNAHGPVNLMGYGNLSFETSSGTQAFIGAVSPSLAGYDLKSPFGPEKANVNSVIHRPVPVSFGSFTFSTISSVTFSAVLGNSAPEPLVSPKVRFAGNSFLVNRQAAKDYQYTGTCPVDLNPGWRVTGDGPETVKYSFVRSDGTHSATPLTATLANANQSVQLQDDWKIGVNTAQFQNFNGWVQLNIEAPNAISQRIGFALHCEAAAPADLVWPQEFTDAGIHLLLYQPQVDSWKDNKLEARAAASATREGQTNEIFGIATITARTEVDKNSRMVWLEDIKVGSVSFPGSGPSEGDLSQLLRNNIPNLLSSISLDRLLADAAVGNAEIGSQSAGPTLKNDPPKIVFSTTPAVLILIDGDPVLRDVAGTKYKRVVNTPALLLQDPATSAYYLDGRTLWMTAASLNGPWHELTDVPAELNQVRAQVLASEDQDPHDHSADAATPAANQPPPAVYVSTVPAELIQTQGEPEYVAIPKTKLMYIQNSGSDIFADAKKQNYYVLLSGRWYTAKSLSGPWSFIAGEKLPGDFSHIPPDNSKASVLASIPGTVEAKEAVTENQVPQTATIKRSEAKLTVSYDGPPQFKPIKGTTLEYAINTSVDVIHADGRYYGLQDAVWFVASSPTGPWVVADTIPPAIYTIPPSSPMYRVRFVYVFGSNQDYVDFGYTPGYLGAFVDDGVVVFGTGWWYPCWIGDEYFGWPWTWGFGFQFGYWTGGWFWQPIGSHFWYHNPPSVHRVYTGHWNPHWAPNDPERLRANANVYSRWPAAAVTQRPVAQPVLASAKSPAGDVYAGKDGKVYEHRTDGWYQRDNAHPPQKVKPAPQLDQQREARSLGAARQNEFRNTGHTAAAPHVSAPHFSAPRGGGGGGGGGGRRR